jgi:hypothetical protein
MFIAPVTCDVCKGKERAGFSTSRLGGELLEHRRCTSRARRGLTPLDPKVIRRIHPRELGGAEYIAVCVPAFLDGHGAPRSGVTRARESLATNRGRRTVAPR